MKKLPVPSFFDESKMPKVWSVPYEERATQAHDWAKRHSIPHASQDKTRVCLMVIDAQNTFCTPGFELVVGGAVEDNVRLCRFIYENLHAITSIAPTMDTHTDKQIFHPEFWVGQDGKNPPPMTMITEADLAGKKWQVNPAVAFTLGAAYNALVLHAEHYVKKLSAGGRYALMVWPRHAMLGGIGHALVSCVEEALFFHNATRESQTTFEIKGGNPLTENYSVLGPEVLTTHGEKPIAQKNTLFIDKLLKFDAVVIAGQAKSHCVSWTIFHLLSEIQAKDPSLAQKVYLLEDCTSPVVVPGVIDFTQQANEAFDKFAKAGMKIVRTTQPLDQWPGLNIQ